MKMLLLNVLRYHEKEKILESFMMWKQLRIRWSSRNAAQDMPSIECSATGDNSAHSSGHDLWEQRKKTFVPSTSKFSAFDSTKSRVGPLLSDRKADSPQQPSTKSTVEEMDRSNYAVCSRIEARDDEQKMNLYPMACKGEQASNSVHTRMPKKINPSATALASRQRPNISASSELQKSSSLLPSAPNSKLTSSYSLSTVRTKASPRMPRRISVHQVPGTVKWFDIKKGYGYIILCDTTKEELVVHHRNISAPNPAHTKATLAQGEPVVFDIAETSLGREAINVTGPNGVAVEGSKLLQDPRLLFDNNVSNPILKFFKRPDGQLSSDCAFPLSSTEPGFFQEDSDTEQHPVETKTKKSKISDLTKDRQN